MENRKAKKSGAFGWFMQRISGVMLLFTLITHYWVQHLPTDNLSNPQEYEAIRTAYMKDYPDVKLRTEYAKAVESGHITAAREGEHIITYEKVMGRLSSPLWKVFDLMFLVFGLYHGTNGMLNIIDDYARNKGIRLTLISLLWILSAAVLIQGVLTVFTAGVYHPPIGLENILTKVATN